MPFRVLPLKGKEGSALRTWEGPSPFKGEVGWGMG